MRFLQSDIVAFLESSPSGDIWKVIIIEEGLSKNGKFYTKEALQRSIPLFEKSKVCFYEWKDKHFDHVPLSIEKIRPEGFPLQTAGWLDNIKYETVKVEGREVTGLTGSLHLLEGNSKVQELKQTIVDAWKKGLKNFLGLSINAEGPSSVRMLNGQPISVVSGITRVFSTDFVTQPAAGGELLKIIESLQFGGNEMNDFKKLLEALKNFSTKIFESVDVANITEEEATSIFESLVKEAKEKKSDKAAALEAIAAKMKEKKYAEAEALLAAVKKEAIALSDEELLKADDASLSPEDLKRKKDLLANKGKEDAVAEAKKKQEEIDGKQKTLEAKLADMEKKAKARECKEMLQLALDESNLPEPVKGKIKKSFENKVFNESEMKESIKIERETLAALIESGATIDLGGDIEGSFVEREPITKLQASMDIMFGYKPSADELKESFKDIEGFNSLREAYIAYTDDPMISGKMGVKALARLREATEASFSYALGFSMQRRMLPEYNAIAPLWKKIAVTSNIKDFKLQERIQWGGFGVLPEVQAARTVAGTPIDSETPTYPQLGFPGDSETKYAVATKGGLVTITRRMIIDDDLRILAGLPKKLGKAAAYTLNQFVFDLMLSYGATGINTATIGDSVVLYATAHKNYRTAALGYDNLYDLLNDMYYQCEFGYAGHVETQIEAGGTSLVLHAGTGQYFKAGDLIWIAGEILRCDVVTTDTITVARGLYGTTDAVHAVDVAVKKITQVLATQNPTLWVPRGLRGTALALKTSVKHPENAEGGDNTLRDAFEVEVSPYLRGDENNYYLSAKTSDIEGIEIGFLNGREEPEILVQDQPTVDNVFVYDQIRYKVRHEYGGAVVDFKAFAGAIVS